MLTNPYEPPRKTHRPWNWLVFVVLVLIVTIHNLSFGTCQQIEEVLWVPEDERAQTNSAEFGWPFPCVWKEAYTLTPIFYYSRTWTILLACADAVITTFVVIAGTKYLSSLIDNCGWRPDILSGLVLIAVFAGQLTRGVEYFGYRDGAPGAVTYALFNVTTPFLFVCSAFAWHWGLSSVGDMLLRRLK